MNNKKIIFLPALILGFGLTTLQAQETITSAGGNASGNGGSVSYTVGQLVYTTNTGSNGSVTQGVQQPFEISVISGIAEAKRISLNCSAYPNPTKGFVNLIVENYQLENLSYQIYDINGKLLEIKKIDARETSIPLLNLVPSTYLLKVIQGSKEVKTFKIIKN
jgi:hypothetical protein